MAKEAAEKKKVKRPTAQKREDQNEKRRLRNKSFRSKVRTAIRQFDETLAKGESEKAKESMNLVYSLMDIGVKKGVFKLNKASRTKERVAARISSKN